MVTLFVRQLLLLGVVVTLQVTTTAAFVVNPSLAAVKSGPVNTHGRPMTLLAAAPNNSNSKNKNSNPLDVLSTNLGKALATTFLVTASLWSTPGVTSSSPFFPNQQAMAKEMASGSGSRVNKDPESLLRYGLPINNKEVRIIPVSKV
jgi:hypothetical protein